MDLRTVEVDYSPGQSPWTMTVVCVDGSTFAMRVIPPGPGPASSDGPETGLDADVRETEDGGLNLRGRERSDDLRGPARTR
jgi:hypothetical protein